MFGHISFVTTREKRVTNQRPMEKMYWRTTIWGENSETEKEREGKESEGKGREGKGKEGKENLIDCLIRVAKSPSQYSKN